MSSGGMSRWASGLGMPPPIMAVESPRAIRPRTRKTAAKTPNRSLTITWPFRIVESVDRIGRSCDVGPPDGRRSCAGPNPAGRLPWLHCTSVESVGNHTGDRSTQIRIRSARGDRPGVVVSQQQRPAWTGGSDEALVPLGRGDDSTPATERDGQPPEAAQPPPAPPRPPATPAPPAPWSPGGPGGPTGRAGSPV